MTHETGYEHLKTRADVEQAHTASHVERWTSSVTSGVKSRADVEPSATRRCAFLGGGTRRHASRVDVERPEQLTQMSKFPNFEEKQQCIHVIVVVAVVVVVGARRS